MPLPMRFTTSNAAKIAVKTAPTIAVVRAARYHGFVLPMSCHHRFSLFFLRRSCSFGQD